jgi:hypothetical protein
MKYILKTIRAEFEDIWNRVIIELQDKDTRYQKTLVFTVDSVSVSDGVYVVSLRKNGRKRFHKGVWMFINELTGEISLQVILPNARTLNDREIIASDIFADLRQIKELVGALTRKVYIYLWEKKM